MKQNEYLKMRLLEDSHFWFFGKKFFAKVFIEKANFAKNKKLNILDIGSGTGGMTAFLKTYGKVLGVEKNSLAVKLARERGLDILEQDANSISFKNSEFDLVTIFDVLYHKNIKDEVELLLRVKKVLNPGGHLLITDSALDFLKSRHDIEVEGKRRYTVKSMTKILDQSGFEVVSASYIYFSIFPIVFVKRMFLDKILLSKESDVKEVNKTVNQFLLNVLKVEAKLLKYISFPIGSSVIILARKNPASATHVAEAMRAKKASGGQVNQ